MFKTWFMAMRPWSFTAAAVPVALGTAFAYNQGIFDPSLFILALVGGIAIQAGTNLTNTYGDYISGVDTINSCNTNPHLVLGILKPEAMKKAGILAFSLAAVIGVYLVYLRGWELLFLGMIGIFGGYTYTLGPLPYKYQGLGSLLVFFLMGSMMVWGAYFVQTGLHSWPVIWLSLPISFLVSGILHANDIRDIDDDLKAGIRTLAMTIGRKNSFTLYFLLYIAAFSSVIILPLLKITPVSAALPLILLPQGYKILRSALDSWRGDVKTLGLLEIKSAQFHFQFGLLLVIGLLADSLFR